MPKESFIKPKKNLSLFPLKAEQALSAFMKIDPKLILAAEAREQTDTIEKQTP